MAQGDSSKLDAFALKHLNNNIKLLGASMTNNKENPKVSEIISAESLESFVLNNFTGETLGLALAEHKDREDLYSQEACKGIMQYHGKEIEEIVPRDDAISAIHEGGKYDHDDVMAYQVHQAVYDVMNMFQIDFIDIIEANPKKPLNIIVSTDTPEYLQDPSCLVGQKGGLEGFIHDKFLGRDIYFAAQIARNTVAIPMAEALYKKYKPAIESAISTLPPERRLTISNAPIARVNRAITMLASEIFVENAKLILNNPTKTLPDARKEILFGRGN